MSGVWNHVVFVNLDGNAPALETYLAPLAAEHDHLDVAALELGHRRTWQFNANWKLVMENWEVYHHVWVHEGVFDKMSDEVNLGTGAPYTDMIADGNILMLRATKDRPARRVNAPTSGPALPGIPTLYDRNGPVASANAVLPNTTVSIGPVSYAPAIYVPIAPGITEARMAWYFAPGAAVGPEYESAREAVLDRWLGPSRSFEAREGIRSQDHRCMELQQAARQSPIANDVKFSTTWEANVRYFQDWIVTQIDA
jgi:phenylpropionate dioxygenase-like ring-hydroxylating dioxygenase large terminal subunit